MIFGWFDRSARERRDWERGYAYAASHILKHRGVTARLESEAEGEIEPDSYPHFFNVGMRAAISHFREIHP